MDHLFNTRDSTTLGDSISTASPCCANVSSVTSILEIVEGEARLQQNLDRDSLQNWIAANEANPSPDRPVFRIFFVSGMAVQATKHVHIEPGVLLALHHGLGLPAKFISDVYGTEPWAILRITSRVRRQHANPDSLMIQYGFSPWVDSVYSHSFLHSQTRHNLTSYFCINFPDFLTASLVEGLISQRRRIQQPLLVDIWIANDLLQRYRQGIAIRRDKLVGIEKQIITDAETRQLHRLAVQWRTLSKELTELTDQTIYLQSCLRKHTADIYQSVAPEMLEESDELMADLISSCQYYQSWTLNYRDRANGQINLFYHLDVQADNRVMREISNLSAQVALQTQRDSALMTILTVVATVFLPTTFVATIFSTVFFDSDESSFKVYDKWWMLPVAGVSLTVLIFMSGLLFLNWRQKQTIATDPSKS